MTALNPDQFSVTGASNAQGARSQYTGGAVPPIIVENNFSSAPMQNQDNNQASNQKAHQDQLNYQQQKQMQAQIQFQNQQQNMFAQQAPVQQGQYMVAAPGVGQQMACLPNGQACFEQSWNKVPCPERYVPAPAPCATTPQCPPTPMCPTTPCATVVTAPCVTKPACPPEHCATGGFAWSGVAWFVLWFIIFIVLFWLIYYSLAPTWVRVGGVAGAPVDTGRVLLLAVLSALVLIVIVWIVKWAVTRCY